MKTFEVDEISLGESNKGDRIVFKSIEDLQAAREEVDNGKGLFVMTPDGLITEFPHRMIYQKIYDGTIKLSAKMKMKEAKK